MDAVTEEKQKGRAKTRVNADVERIGSLIENALTSFHGMIQASAILEIDAYLEKGDMLSDKDYTAEEDGFKVINHELESAYFVPLDKIVRSSCEELRGIVEALANGIFQRVQGVTRIVGYYSRVYNWNASKIAELRDRRIGNYWNKPRANSVKIEGIGEK